MSSHPKSLLVSVVFLVGLLLIAGRSLQGAEPAPPQSNQGYLGIGYQTLTQAVAQEGKMPDNRGVLVTSVRPQSSAAAAGLKEGDVLIEFAGKEIADVAGFGSTIRLLSPGKTIAVKFTRDGKNETTTITVGETPLAVAYYRRGHEKANSGDQPGAIADFTEAIRLDPQDSDAYVMRGFAKANSGDPAGAIVDYTEAIRHNPQNWYAYLNRGWSKANSGDLDGAFADYAETLRLDPQNTQAYFNRGSAKANSGNLSGAIADYTEAIHVNPKMVLAYFNRGILKQNSGDRDGAIADYTETIRLEPKITFAYIDRGICKASNGDRDGAIADYTEAIRLEPKNAVAYFNRGLAKHNKADWGGAIADYTEAIGLDPKHADAFFDRGLAKTNSGVQVGSKKLGRSETAAAKKRSEEAIADYTEASRLYTEAIRIDPNNSQVYASRAKAKDQLGDGAGAVQDRAMSAKINEQVTFAKFHAEVTKASLSDLFVSSEKTEAQARERNRAIIAAKNQQLPGILRDKKTDELSALVVKIEQTILDLNHESEVAKDRAQQTTATNGDARQLEELRGLTISYRERIELLKPILTALKEEIANRNR